MTISCPKYESCSAAICPLYKPIVEQRMLPSERVCSILLETQKPRSEVILIAQYGKEIYEVMAQATKLAHAHGTYPLRRALRIASQTGSRLANLGYLHSNHQHAPA
jgi:hypothetical protein